MDEKDVVQTVYGKHHRYQIVKHPGALSNTTYTIYRDGSVYRGSFSSLKSAVEAAQAEE